MTFIRRAVKNADLAIEIGRVVPKGVSVTATEAGIDYVLNDGRVIKSRPVDGIPGRRSMPQFDLSDEELEGVAEFLKWTSEIDDANWPPNIQG